ncbi:MAG: nitrilase-related carbon-nitrogen hydrolase, partial [bacterium]|nr:nitrilase-related carbon-nitrogen hydrolase [bacterium]
MRCLRVGMAQINTVVGDLAGNRKKIVSAIRAARRKGVQLLAFPELAVTGYPPKDLLLKASFIRKNRESIEKIVPESKGMCVVLGFVDLEDDLYNGAAILHDGRWIGTQHKVYLPNYDVFDENRYFQVGAESFLFKLDTVLFGVNICEDIWFPGGPTMHMGRSGAEVVVNISASPFHAGKASIRREMISTRAKDNATIVMFTNLVGGQDDLVFDGRSMIANPEGDVIARGNAFEEDLVVCDLNLAEVGHKRLRSPRNRRKTYEARMRGELLSIIESRGTTAHRAKRRCRKTVDPRTNPFLMKESTETY